MCKIFIVLASCIDKKKGWGFNNIDYRLKYNIPTINSKHNIKDLDLGVKFIHEHIRYNIYISNFMNTKEYLRLISSLTYSNLVCILLKLN